jgi:hypothetical protein
MSRYRRGEYRAERRAKPAQKTAALEACQGDMGMCGKKKAAAPCARCRKPYCPEHAEPHTRFCLGVR